LATPAKDEDRKWCPNSASRGELVPEEEGRTLVLLRVPLELSSSSLEIVDLAEADWDDELHHLENSSAVNPFSIHTLIVHAQQILLFLLPFFLASISQPLFSFSSAYHDHYSL
jgi:hypothetical protein